jgi:Holliday junction resolvase RusA-like endonuclease
VIAFTAHGKPETKGSTRAFMVAGRPRITNDNPRAKTWAGVVSSAAYEATGGRLLSGPLSVRIVFYLQRPKAHSNKRGLRPDAPTHSASKPDVDKLARCALDALTGVVFGDDSQVARLEVEKRYTSEVTGATFEVLGLVSEWREDTTKGTEF